MSIDFGSIDPAAFIIALIALLIGLESILNPLCVYVRIPRAAYTIFYRESMIFSYDPKTPSEYDWIVSIAVSRTAFFGDTPIGLGQWLLYPISQIGSGILTALVLIIITPIWLLKFLYFKLISLSIFAMNDNTPLAFHQEVLGNLIWTLGKFDSLYSKNAQGVLCRLALSMGFPLGDGTIAFSQVGSSGIWVGVFYDLSKYGCTESTDGYKHVMAGNVCLSLKTQQFFNPYSPTQLWCGISPGF